MGKNICRTKSADSMKLEWSSDLQRKTKQSDNLQLVSQREKNIIQESEKHSLSQPSEYVMYNKYQIEGPMGTKSDKVAHNWTKLKQW